MIGYWFCFSTLWHGKTVANFLKTLNLGVLAFKRVVFKAI